MGDLFPFSFSCRRVTRFWLEVLDVRVISGTVLCLNATKLLLVLLSFRGQLHNKTRRAPESLLSCWLLFSPSGIQGSSTVVKGRPKVKSPTILIDRITY